MEAYAVDELVAMADVVQPGLGALAGVLAGLVGELTGDGLAAASFDVIEGTVMAGGWELLRLVVQHALDVRAAAEPRLAGVADAQGVARPRAERGRGRRLESLAGPVVVRRIAYRAPGLASLHPRDAVLGLPPRVYSWGLQGRVVSFAVESSYEQAAAWLAATTGTVAGKRQAEQVVMDAARDAAAFGAARPLAGPAPPGVPLVISADAKGVAMRPEARRKRYGKAGQRSKSYGKRLGTGEKRGVKRMAQVAVVFDAIAPDEPRTPELIMGCAPAGPDGAPAPRAGQVRAEGRWYATDITASRDVTIKKAFGEAARRDPDQERDWVVLVDGDCHQIAAIEEEATRRGAEITILIDLIHVLEYLWKAAWAVHPARDPAAEAWVITQATDILHGHAADVATRISHLDPLPGTEHHRNHQAAISYLTNKQPYLDYPAALERGWPIATSVIETTLRYCGWKRHRF